ncbi:MAG: hypothetical protein GXO76_03480 [Calditrichaeota bacterium]|nr:hypothetical protein [Calditrichota bacterium]
MVVKTFKLKHLSPQQALNQIMTSGVIGYLFNWGHTIDEENNTITFTIRHGGGDAFIDEEKQAAKNLEEFIRAIDV